MNKLQKRDLAVGLALLTFSLLGLFVVIPLGVVTPGELEFRALSPSFWPMIVMSGLVITSIVICIGSLISNHRTSDQPSPLIDEIEDHVEDRLPLAQGVMKGGAVIALFFSYYWSINYIGIIAASIVTMILLMLLGGERHTRIVIPVSFTLPVVLYYFFTHIANIPLPLGLFESLR